MCCSQHDEPRRGKSRRRWRRPITIIIIKGLWAGGRVKRYTWGIYVVTCYHSLLRFTGRTQGSFDSTRCVKCGTRQKEVRSEAMEAEARPLRGFNCGFNRSRKKTDYFAVKVNVKKMLSFTPRVYCVWLCIHLHRAFATVLCASCYLLAEKLPSGETNRLNYYFFSFKPEVWRSLCKLSETKLTTPNLLCFMTFSRVGGRSHPLAVRRINTFSSMPLSSRVRADILHVNALRNTQSHISAIDHLKCDSLRRAPGDGVWQRACPRLQSHLIPPPKSRRVLTSSGKQPPCSCVH